METESLPSSSQLLHTPPHPPPTVHPEETQHEKAQDNCAHQRNDFSEPRLLHLPINRKVLNFNLRCLVVFNYWSSFEVPTTWSLLQNLLCILALPLPLERGLSEPSESPVSQA